MLNKKFVVYGSLIGSLCLSGIIWKVSNSYTAEVDLHDHDEDHDEIWLSEQQIAAAGITIQKAAPGDIQKLVQSPGKVALNLDHAVHIVPKASGIVLKTYKNIGDPVKAGEVIAVLQSREIAEAKSEYLAAMKQHELVSTVLESEQKLYDKKISAAQDYHAAKGSVDKVQIDKELARQKLHALGLSKDEVAKLADTDPVLLGVYEMVSPISGTIVEKNLTTGEMLNTDREAFIVADLGTLWGELVVYPNDFPQVRKGQAVELTCGDLATSSKIAHLSPAISDETRTAKAIVVIDNSKKEWHPGTYFCSTIRTTVTPVAIMIPKDAVQKIDGNDVVFLYDEEAFTVQPVVLGISDSKNVEVTAGLTAGQKYAASNTFILKADHGKDEAEHMD